MSNTPEDPKTHAQLRHTAEVRIRTGLAPATHGWTMGAASLGLLHRLASDAATASDALKLLHELQVHQVELDLQHEHMEEPEQETPAHYTEEERERLALELSASRLADLFVFAPMAYFMVTRAGHVVEGNVLAARLLGVDRDDVGSCNISRLVLPASRSALQALLDQVLASGARHSCRVQALDTARTRYLEVIASCTPDGQLCQVVITDVSDSPSPGLQA